MKKLLLAVYVVCVLITGILACSNKNTDTNNNTNTMQDSTTVAPTDTTESK